MGGGGKGRDEGEGHVLMGRKVYWKCFLSKLYMAPGRACASADICCCVRSYAIEVPGELRTLERKHP